MLDLCRINDKNVYCFIVENLKGVNPGSGYTQEAIETVFLNDNEMSSWASRFFVHLK